MNTRIFKFFYLSNRRAKSPTPDPANNFTLLRISTTEIQENEGDDQSIDSLEISEPDVDVPEAPTPEPAPAPAPAASRPTRDRHPPDFLSPRMSGQYHGGEMTFTCDIYLAIEPTTNYWGSIAVLG